LSDEGWVLLQIYICSLRTIEGNKTHRCSSKMDERASPSRKDFASAFCSQIRRDCEPLVVYPAALRKASREAAA